MIPLEAATLLQERIRCAKRNASVVDFDSMGRSLAQLVRQPVIDRGLAEEIFPGEGRRTDASFIFRQVKGGQEIANLTNTLRAQLGQKDRWPFDVWLDRANDKSWTVIEVRREDEDVPAGFAVIVTDLRLENRTVTNRQSTVVLSLDLNSVYVVPSKRGEGHSQALSWAIGKQVDHILQALAQSPASNYQLDVPQVEILIEGEAHSESGAKFLTGTFERIECNINLMNVDGAWFDMPTVIDGIDIDKFARLAELRR